MIESEARDGQAYIRHTRGPGPLQLELRAFNLADSQGTALIEAMLAALGLAAFICDGRGAVRGMTPAAAQALERGRLRLAEGRLMAPPGFDVAEMEAAITQAASAEAPAARIVVNRDRLEPAAAQVLDVIALPQQRPFEPRVVVVLRGRLPGTAELEAILARAFGLTAAEAEVAARLARGERREAIAAARRASLQTVRSQIKSIFSKLGVTREPQLVALLARLAQR